jgi:ankyrin repeat protein
MSRPTPTDRLHAAIVDQRIDIARSLIDAGANVNAPDRFKQTPLLAAVQQRNLDLISLLLHAGADVNRGDAEGYTPLMEAANLLERDIVQALLEHGAKIDARSGGGATPLIYAVYAACENFMEHEPDDVVAVLLSKAADAGIRDNKGKTALDIAKERENESYVQLLTQAGNH